MRIIRIDTINFQGLSGTRNFTLPDKITALSQPNGTDKTSLLSALRFCLTGIRPAWSLVTKGENMAAVQVTFEDGQTFIRQEHPNACFIGKQKVTQKEFSERLSAKTGLAADMLKVVTSSELLASMAPQDFGNMILNYVPEKPSVDTILPFVTDLTKEKEDCIRSYFGNGTFPKERISEFSSFCEEKRRERKRRAADAEYAIRSLSGKIPEGCTKEEAQKELASLQSKMQAALEEKGKRTAYDRMLADKARQEKQIEELKKEIQKNDIQKPDQKQEEAIAGELTKKRQALVDAREVYGTVVTSLQAVQKALDLLDTPYCPLSKKLFCTTDKTGVRKELEDAVSESKKTLDQQIEKGQKLAGEVSRLEQELKAIQLARASWEKKESLKAQLAEIEKVKITLPENAPQTIDTKQIEIRMNELRTILAAFENQKAVTEKQKELSDAKKDIAFYDSLCKDFAKKGAVPEQLMQKYMSAFEDACNMKADELTSGMRFRFTSNAGVLVEADPKGTGAFLPYAALSGGEKIEMLYILLDMMSMLSGSRMIILDELSVMDKDTFERFLKLVLAHQNEYDQIFLSMASHSDMEEILDKYGINILQI